MPQKNNGTKLREALKLRGEEVRRNCTPEMCPWESTLEVPPLEGVIGQERAMRALDFGLGMDRPGYNIFVSGVPGTGRMTTVVQALEKIARDRPVPDDWCYVYNFESPDCPRALRFPAGTGRRFQKDISRLVEVLRVEVPRVFESKEYEDQRASLGKELQEKKQSLLAELERKAENEGFQLKQTSSGLVIMPLHDGKPLSEAEFDKLGESEKGFYREKQQHLQKEISEIMRRVRRQEQRTRERVRELDRETGVFAVSHHFEELAERYREFPEALGHLKRMKEEMVNNIHDFLSRDEQPEILPGVRMPSQKPDFLSYQVNLLVDNSELKGAPVVRETNPTYLNLIGRQEHRPQFGSFLTDFTMIKDGALHRANGGYLVLYARDLFSKYFSWQALKRCLETGSIRVEDLTEEFHLISTVSHRPEPIPLTAKVLIVGDEFVYQLLYAWDENFAKWFQVKADFDTRLECSREAVARYASFIGRHCREKKLLPFDRSGISAVVEHGSRLAGDREKLTSRFQQIVSIIEEADFWARRAGREMVGGKEVRQAEREKSRRSNRIEERIREMIVAGQILIDDRGEVTGQVNGLSVLMLGDHAFGRPSRITVRTFAGREGIVDVERETKLGGPIHTKGVLILNGFLGERFASERPLTLSATICFEQSYDGIEGDSASSAELYALLSSLSGLPLRQDIAVTGSVNQRGQVQPIGGVNEKVEGFFDVCRTLGLTGTQGVIIPRSNMRNLMLRADAARAVEEGSFHVWAVESIEEGIEILTGVPAGRPGRAGRYPAASVYGRVAARLDDYNRAAREDEPAARGGKRRRPRRRKAVNGEAPAGS